MSKQCQNFKDELAVVKTAFNMLCVTVLELDQDAIYNCEKEGSIITSEKYYNATVKAIYDEAIDKAKKAIFEDKTEKAAAKKEKPEKKGYIAFFKRKAK